MSGGDGIGKIHRGLKKTLYVGGEGGGAKFTHTKG